MSHRYPPTRRRAPPWLLVSLLACLLYPAGYGAEDEEDAFDQIDRLLDQQFEEIDLTLEEQFERLDQAMEDAYQRLSEEIEREWGDDEVKLPSKKEWVDYSPDLKSRRSIDFEKGVIKLERLVEAGDQVADVVRDVQEAATALKADTPSDLAKKDLAVEYAREALAADGIDLEPPPVAAEPPVLQDIDTTIPEAAAIETLVTTAVGGGDKAPGGAAVAAVESVSPTKKKVTVEIPLASGYQQKMADRYRAAVMAEADRQEIAPSLLFAVMETESSFNPRATSGVPAYGLMQLVPRSGAMDAYNYVYGEKALLDPEYLYQPGNNVELGSAYLNLLQTRYLRWIEDPQSRKYCAIAAYNTGAGNVARTFTGKNNVREAAKIINTMEPNEVYDYLKANLPYDETRRYIEKVTKAETKYAPYDRS